MTAYAKFKIIGYFHCGIKTAPEQNTHKHKEQGQPECNTKYALVF
jgi:hypothetical protein